MGQFRRMHKTWRETVGEGGVREIWRTVSNGQKVYGNDPVKERRLHGVESQRGTSVNAIK